jgi:hypothetical protein
MYAANWSEQFCSDSGLAPALNCCTRQCIGTQILFRALPSKPTTCRIAGIMDTAALVLSAGIHFKKQ